MTRKDFETVALVLSWATRRHDLDKEEKQAITVLLKDNNPKFDEEMFWKKVWNLQNGRIEND
ncbi:MAG: hypothetical protein ACI4TD_04310 [Phocaeicola sp.]